MVAYEMRGQFLEACDCSVPCPCWFEESPEEDECTGVVAWQIEQGTIDGIEVSGLTAVSVSRHGGHRGGPGEHAKMRVSLFVNEEASEQQEQAIGRAFTGELGGPLAELAEMNDEEPGVERAMIAFTSDGGTTKLTVGRVVSTELKPLVGATERVVTVADGVMAKMLGTPGEVCKTTGLTLDVPRISLKLEVEGRSATRGRFAYVGH